MENKRSSFGSNFGFLMAAIGSAVGLGNIWGFPYKMGKSGGFAFLVIYLVLAVIVGLTIMSSELARPAPASSARTRRSPRNSNGSAGWVSSPPSSS